MKDVDRKERNHSTESEENGCSKHETQRESEKKENTGES